MNYLVTYANQKYRYNQILNKKSAKKLNFFDKIFIFNPRKIEKVFLKKNQKTILQERGGGYWLWKPYIILKTLERAKEGDIIFYCDSGCVFLDSVVPLCQLLDKYSQDIIPFEVKFSEKQYTKKDAFLLMNCDRLQFTETRQRIATFILIKNSDFSQKFVREWLDYAQDPRILTNLKNTQGQENYPGFIGHRHDQSIYSLLTKKYDLVGFRDPSQWGNELINDYPNSEYGQIMDHTRYQRDPNLRFWIFRQFDKLSQKLENDYIRR